MTSTDRYFFALTGDRGYLSVTLGVNFFDSKFLDRFFSSKMFVDESHGFLLVLKLLKFFAACLIDFFEL